MFLKHILQIFYAPDDAMGGTGGSSQSDLDILNEPDVETTTDEEAVAPVEEAEEPGEVTFEEPVEEEAKDSEDEEDEESRRPVGKDEPEDATVPDGQLRFKDVKAKYPNIFKEMPQLAQAIRNDRAYSEIFATPEDARDAAQRASYFNGLETKILSGSIKELLNDVEQGDKEAFKRVVKDFLPTIKEKSMELFAEITLPAVNDVLRSAIRDADGTENVNLRNAALHIAKYLYGKPEIPNLEAKKEPNPEEEKISKERQAFWQEKAADFTNECYSEGRETVISEIAKGIDKDSSISPFLKKTLKDSIFTEVDQLLAKDTRHLRQMNNLWRKAESTGFQKETRKEIINAYLRGAKALIPSIRQKLRAEAGLQPKNQQPKEQETSKPRTNIPPSGRQAPGQAANKVPSARDVNWGKTSDLDFLNGKYTPKRRSQ
jgi:hypothetical protein